MRIISLLQRRVGVGVVEPSDDVDCWRLLLAGRRRWSTGTQVPQGGLGMHAWFRRSTGLCEILKKHDASRADHKFLYFFRCAVRYLFFVAKKNKTKNCVSKCSRAPLSKIIILLQLSLCFFCSMVADLSTFGLGLTRFLLKLTQNLPNCQNNTLTAPHVANQYFDPRRLPK